MKSQEGLRCLCNDFVHVTEVAALAAGRWMGRGDAAAADMAAIEAMSGTLNKLPISGTVVIGEEAQGDAALLRTGDKVGVGGRLCDIAVDALEGRDIVARGQSGAVSVVAATTAGKLMSMPNMYMQKLVVGPLAAGRVDIDGRVTDTLLTIAEIYGRSVEEVTVIVLDRPRHDDLIAEIRRAGARIRLITDGDVTAGIAVAVDRTNDQLYIGIGGAAEGVLTAVAMRCLGGEIQARLWPLSRREVESARDHGIDDIEMTLKTEDMVGGEVLFAATGVTSGEFLDGVQYLGWGVRTHSMVMCNHCNEVRFVRTTHLNTDTRREIRL
ncbi:MAG TPA: class II fructose-bisphosphatase [Thermoleophilia bacterium]|nr:class II fructose-bisphosphatase [Thermoleophilia bacterium]